jgi:hypothetical protein
VSAEERTEDRLQLAADRDCGPDDAAVAALLSGLLRRTHLSAPSDLAAVIADEALVLGASDTKLYLINYELDQLMPLPASDENHRQPLSVMGTVAGRAFSDTTILESRPGDGHGCRLWVPLLDGTERLGVIGMTFASGPASERLMRACERYAHLVAMLVVTKGAYGDAFTVTRRQRTMTIASELVWSMAPPLVFSTDHLVVAGMLEPAYDNGGDALDYAVNDGILHLGVFDAMGHGLGAAGVAAFALAAYRHSRRTGLGLQETYRAMHEAVEHQFPGDRFVTAAIGRLDLRSGELTWISAGHPPPLVFRNGRHARTLNAPPALPLGVALQQPAPKVAREALEPGDMLLLYTDGLTEARGTDGKPFEIDGITAFIEREAAAGHAAPETLRRLRQTLIAEHAGSPDDDATALLVEWKRGAERELLPPTVVSPRR